MKKKIILPLIAAAMLVLAAVFAGCEENSRPTVEDTTTNGNTEQIMRYNVRNKKDFYTPLYDWYRKTQRTYDGEGFTYWNNNVAKKLSCNWICVYPAGKYKTKDEWATNAFILDIDRIIEYTADGLADSHRFGIKVMTSAPVVEIFDETYKDYGIDPDQFKMVKPDGTLADIYDNTQGLKFGYACYENEKFIAMITEYTEKVAKAGFDGCLYDGFNFAYPPNYYCSCEGCKNAWAKYSADLYGEALPFPTPRRLYNMMDSDEKARAFCHFRLSSLADFYLMLRDAGRKYNPEFEVYTNSTMYDMGMAYFYLRGLDVTTSEFKDTTKLGTDSTLFMYAENEALTDKQLISFINRRNVQCPDDNQYYTPLFESYAAGGAMCHAEVSRTYPIEAYTEKTALNFMKIVSENKEAFEKTGSVADTAVLYSWRDTTYCQIKELKLNYSTNLRETWELNSSRRAAALLARRGIPFDYVVAEKNPTASDLSRYKTVIVPELTLLDRTLEAELKKYVENGGRLLITGKEFGTVYSGDEVGIKWDRRETDLLESWVGTAYGNTEGFATYRLGSGSISVCRDYIKLRTTEEESEATADFEKAVSELDLTSQVRVEAKPAYGYIETTLRADCYGTALRLNIINNGVPQGSDTGKNTVSLEIPKGAEVKDVTALSPCTDDIGLEYSVKDGRLTVSGSFGLYTLVTVSLQWNG